MYLICFHSKNIIKMCFAKSLVLYFKIASGIHYTSQRDEINCIGFSKDLPKTYHSPIFGKKYLYYIYINIYIKELFKMIFIKKNWKGERYVVAHTILRRMPFFYFSEIKIGLLKRILVRGAKRPMRHHRPIDMCRTKKKLTTFICYNLILYNIVSIQNYIKMSNKKKLWTSTVPLRGLYGAKYIFLLYILEKNYINKTCR